MKRSVRSKSSNHLRKRKGQGAQYTTILVLLCTFSWPNIIKSSQDGENTREELPYLVVGIWLCTVSGEPE